MQDARDIRLAESMIEVSNDGLCGDATHTTKLSLASTISHKQNLANDSQAFLPLLFLRCGEGMRTTIVRLGAHRQTSFHSGSVDVEYSCDETRGKAQCGAQETNDGLAELV